MTDIIVIDSEESLSLLIAETLSRSFSVRFYNMNSMYLSGEGDAVNLWRTDSLHGLVTDDCIVVMGENTAAIPRLIPDTAVIIANALNKEQMNTLSYLTCNVITCGNLIMDTVSYTSITDEEISVSFGRTVTTLDGDEIQPFEIPVKRNDAESLYEIMAVTALRLLTGDNSIIEEV